jgi:hypothetical protein
MDQERPRPDDVPRELGPDAITAFRDTWHCLSNPYPCLVYWEGLTYPSSEHAWHAAKTLDPVLRERIQRTRDWREAKALGRTVPLRPGWDRLRRMLMTQILLAKFGYDEDLRARLAATGNRALLEGNPWGDTDWGAVPHTHPAGGIDLPWWHTANDVWAGRNWLGITLMIVRDTLQETA